MRWLGLFTNKTFRKHLKLIFPRRNFIICILSLAIFHPHFVIQIFPSAFCHPNFSIRIFSSTFFHPHFVIRYFPSALYHPHFSIRHPPSAIRHPPPSGPHFTETQSQPCLLRVHFSLTSLLEGSPSLSISVFSFHIASPSKIHQEPMRGKIPHVTVGPRFHKRITCRQGQNIDFPTVLFFLYGLSALWPTSFFL